MKKDKDNIPDLFKVFNPVQEGSNPTPIRIVRIVGYDPRSQLLSVVEFDSENLTNSSKPTPATPLSPVPTSYSTGSQMGGAPDFNTEAIQLALAVSYKGKYYILGYFGLETMSGVKNKTTNDPDVNPGDLFMKTALGTFFQMGSIGSYDEESNIVPTPSSKFFIMDWLQSTYNGFLHRLTSKIGNFIGTFHGGTFA